MSSPQPPESSTTTMPDLFAADASLANIAATTAPTTTTETTETTRDEGDEKTAPQEQQHNKSRYFLRHRPGHTFSAVQVKRKQGCRKTAAGSSATTAAAVVASAAAAALQPTSMTTHSLLKMSPASPSRTSSSSLRFASFAATPTPSSQQQPSQERRSKQMASNDVVAVVAVTPEPSSCSKRQKKQQQQPKIPSSAWQEKNTITADEILLLPLPLPSSSSLRTDSFPALTPNRFPSLKGKRNIVPRTLILGTHPSITSLQQDQYYGHAQNAFWWIAGDCLGFRRGTGISESTGKPFVLTAALRHGTDKIVSYTEQTERLMEAGFLLWDVVASCERAKKVSSSSIGNSSAKSKKKKSTKTAMLSSLDQDIKNEIPNDIRSFCAQQYPTIVRIVFANGSTGSSLFCKHNKEWLASGELYAGADELSQRHLAKACRSSRNSGEKKQQNDTNEASSSRLFHDDEKDKIELIAAISVSPAAARVSFAQKRDWWAKHVYEPGLRDHKDLLLQTAKHDDIF